LDSRKPSLLSGRREAVRRENVKGERKPKLQERHAQKDRSMGGSGQDFAVVEDLEGLGRGGTEGTTEGGNMPNT